ncbi:SdpI family protein [Flavobacterium enshiense]|uniref:SdpI family protein n=1 Tax=Flavobacterium enshiense TaxID=1341165 RepID=UPI00345DE6D0
MEVLNMIFELQILGGLLFTLAGLFQYFFPPKKINSFYGYRTGTSMKSQENWDLAQKISAKKLIQSGVFILLAGILMHFFTPSEKIKMFSSIGLILLGVFYILYTTEQALTHKK